jgi:hypothetical protein
MKMTNQNVPIQIFASPKKQRTYDRHDEQQVTDVIRNEVLPKTKVDYHSVKVKVKRVADGSPESLVAYLLRKDTYTADVQKIDVDKNYKVKTIQEDYDDSEDIDDVDDDESGPEYSLDEYGPVDFVAATPCPEIPTANAAVERVHSLAQRAGLTSIKLKGDDASVANYRRYLRSGLQGFVNIGHGSPNGLVLTDNVLKADWFRELRGDPLTPAVVYFNSCQVFNAPLQPAVMEAGARTFIGGIVNLLIGESEEVCKCFWHRILIRRA